MAEEEWQITVRRIREQDAKSSVQLAVRDLAAIELAEAYSEVALAHWRTYQAASDRLAAALEAYQQVRRVG